MSKRTEAKLQVKREVEEHVDKLIASFEDEDGLLMPGMMLLILSLSLHVLLKKYAGNCVITVILTDTLERYCETLLRGRVEVLIKEQSESN